MFTNRQALEAGIPNIAASPRDHGVVEKIVCRPKTGERQELAQAQLDEALGLVGERVLAVGGGLHGGAAEASW